MELLIVVTSLIIKATSSSPAFYPDSEKLKLHNSKNKLEDRSWVFFNNDHEVHRKHWEQNFHLPIPLLVLGN